MGSGVYLVEISYGIVTVTLDNKKVPNKIMFLMTPDSIKNITKVNKNTFKSLVDDYRCYGYKPDIKIWTGEKSKFVKLPNKNDKPILFNDTIFTKNISEKEKSYCANAMKTKKVYTIDSQGRLKDKPIGDYFSKIYVKKKKPRLFNKKYG